MLFAMILASNFFVADVEAWKAADDLCQPPQKDEQSCLKREEIGLALEKEGLKAYARPGKGAYWEVYWK